MITLADNLGKSTLNRCRDFVALVVFVYLSIRSVLKLRFRNLKPLLYTLTSQIYFTGVMAIPLISFIALATGSVVVIQSTAQLSLLGSKEIMGNILVMTIIRELGPILTAMVVIARSGTAVATELGTMQTNHEIEALRTMSIEPLSYVVFPRILGGVISILCLAFYFNCVALIGGYVVANQLNPVSISFYTEVLAQAMSTDDFMWSIFKNASSGFIIFSIASFEGLKVSGAPHEVPIASTKSVVHGIMAVVAFNLTLSIYIYAKALT